MDLADSRETRGLAERLARRAAEIPDDAALGPEEVGRLVADTGAPVLVAGALERVPVAIGRERWAALGVLAAAVSSAAPAAAPGSAVVPFVGLEEFTSTAEALELPENAARFLYAQAYDHWTRLHPPAPERRSNVSTYLALHRYGITDRTELLQRSDGLLGQSLGVSERAATRLRHHAIRDPGSERPIDFLGLDGKAARMTCCPPLGDPRWRDRFDFFGADSRLAAMVATLEEGVTERIQAAFATWITQPVVNAANAFGVGDPALYDTGAAGAPFYGSGEAVQRITDIRDKTTRAEAEAWLGNMRRQLEQVRNSLRVMGIESYITTSGEDFWGTGDADGQDVRLEVRGSFGAVNVAPAQSGGGWPFDSSNYNDGALAFEFFGSELAILTPIPFGDGTIPALDVTGFRLSYVSFNDWLFDSAQIFFRYAVNPHSGPLTRDQSADANIMRDDDLVHDDQVAGWVSFGDQFDFGIVSASRLAAVKAQFTRLVTSLDQFEASLTAPDLSNVYVVRGDEIVTLLRDAAIATTSGEHELARAKYSAVLEVLSVLDEDNLGPLDRELLFAVHVLIGASYVASDAPAQAYASLVTASDYTADDPESSSYLWFALADLFVKWGDQLYATAGGDFAARLVALDRYLKVTDAQMHLTYKDGREDEVLECWLDLATSAGDVPADAAGWVADLRVRPVSYSGSTPVYGEALPILEHEAVEASVLPAGRFLRVRLDVSEVRCKRGHLTFAVSNLDARLFGWRPSDVRIQARFASYNPLGRPAGLRGPREDLFVRSEPLGSPVRRSGIGTWTVAFSASATAGRIRTVAAPGVCAASLQQSIAQLRIDQIRAHLNVYGIHDEYVPNGRFIALHRLATGIADRAVYLWSRYIDFLARAEAATIEEIDAAALVELSDANVELARERVAAAELNLGSALANEAASGTALGQSSQTLTQFRGTYQIGLLRGLNAFNLNLWPPGVGMNLGGFVGTLSGADGYDAQFRTREMEYEGAVDKARAAAEAAEFHRRLAELEKLMADDTLAIEQLRRAHAVERLDFLRDRTLTATMWYSMAGIYGQLAEARILTAGRWAWIAERALEFEINLRVSKIRMDYHLLPLGAERIRSDLDDLSLALAEFRERYRDVPNVIQREFRFSSDFPQQFRALTSQATAAPAIDMGRGVRAVEFHTGMAEYDGHLPGRYAFGRVLGVEVELQTDIAPGVITGHIENARQVATTVNGSTRRVQVSQSLVRVPMPIAADDAPFCPPLLDLDNSPFALPTLKAAPKDFVEIGDPLDIPDETIRNIPLAFPAAAHVARGGPEDAGRAAISRRSSPVVDAELRRQVFGPLVEYMVLPYRPAPLAPERRDPELPTETRRLLVRAAGASVTAAEIGYAADSLSLVRGEESDDELRERQRAQLATWRERFAARGLELQEADLDALLAIRGQGSALVDAKTERELGARLLKTPGSRGWTKYVLEGELPPPLTVYRDETAGHGALRRRPLDILPDYLAYASDGPAYGLRLKRHDADSLTISAYQLREDAVVFNPYNPGEQLGVFENTGIESDWRLTLRALPANPLNTTPQWDKIRDIVVRVYYHAAYERIEGFRLAETLEPQIIRWNSTKLLALSLYRDFYDEFITLLGDYDEGDPTSLAAVRAFTDESPGAPGGWLRFTLDETLVPAQGQRIEAMAVIFTAPEPSVFPAYAWRLRRGPAGPVVQGTAIEPPGPVAARLSAPAPSGFGGLEVAGDWYLRLARADNPTADLGSLRDIEILIELAPV